MKVSTALTPTSRREIQDMLMDVGENTVVTGGRTYFNMDSKTWQGGVTTVLSPSSLTVAPATTMDLRQDMAAQRKVNRGGGRKPMNNQEEEVSEEEAERRRIRRERNKMAAARCRKRRLDQTCTLQEEVDRLDEKKTALQEEIHALQNQKEELEFILDGHKTVCRRSKLKQENVLLQAKPLIKAEITEDHFDQKENKLNQVDSTTATTSSLGKFGRPATLNLGTVKSNMVRSIEGISIETPTSVITSLNFESLMEGRTGLTPTNILTPVSVVMSGQLLNTPSITSPSCSSQQRNTITASTETDTITANLVSL